MFAHVVWNQTCSSSGGKLFMVTALPVDSRQLGRGKNVKGPPSRGAFGSHSLDRVLMVPTCNLILTGRKSRNLSRFRRAASCGAPSSYLTIRTCSMCKVQAFVCCFVARDVTKKCSRQIGVIKDLYKRNAFYSVINIRIQLWRALYKASAQTGPFWRNITGICLGDSARLLHFTRYFRECDLSKRFKILGSPHNISSRSKPNKTT